MEMTPNGGRLMLGNRPATMSNAKEIANLICRPVTVVKPALAELRDNGVLSEDEHGAIYSRRIDRRLRVAEARSRAGRASAASRGGHFSSPHVRDFVRTNEPTKTPTDRPTPNSIASTNSLDAAASNNSQPPREGGRAGLGPDLASDAPEFVFCRDFLQRGVETGCIPLHECADEWRWIDGKNLAAARVLFGAYSEAEIREKMERFFTAKEAGRIRKPATIQGFADVWSFAELQGATALPSGRSAAVEYRKKQGLSPMVGRQ